MILPSLHRMCRNNKRNKVIAETNCVSKWQEKKAVKQKEKNRKNDECLVSLLRNRIIYSFLPQRWIMHVL